MSSPPDIKEDEPLQAPPQEQAPQDEAAEQQAYDPNAWAAYYDPQQNINASADYSNINVNGVVQLPEHALQGEHLQQDLGHNEHGYVQADEYSGVAATLSNWADANAPDGVLVPPPNTGLEHQPPNGDLHGGQLSDKPKKLVLACHFCRGRKLKCDGGRPTCSHCAKRSLACTYDDAVRRRGPGKRTKEMRERAARETEAAQLGLPHDHLAQLGAGPSTLAEAGPKKPGRKRKHDNLDHVDKKVRLHEDEIAAHTAAAHYHLAEQQLAEHHQLGEHGLGEHHIGEHQLGEHQLGEHQLGDHQQLGEHQLGDHTLAEHQLGEHALGDHSLGDHQLGNVDPTQHGLEHLPPHEHLIDPSLGGDENSADVLDLPPLEPGTLGQVIQQLNGQQGQ